MYSEKRRVLAFVLAMLLIFTSGASFVLAEGEMEQGELRVCASIIPYILQSAATRNRTRAVRALMSIRKSVMSWMRTENRS